MHCVSFFGIQGRRLKCDAGGQLIYWINCRLIYATMRSRVSWRSHGRCSLISCYEVTASPTAIDASFRFNELVHTSQRKLHSWCLIRASSHAPRHSRSFATPPIASTTLATLQLRLHVMARGSDLYIIGRHINLSKVPSFVDMSSFPVLQITYKTASGPISRPSLWPHGTCQMNSISRVTPSGILIHPVLPT